MSLTPTEIKALNDWARTEPTLRGVFPYTEGRPGLGDRLNSLGSGSASNDYSLAFLLGGM